MRFIISVIITIAFAVLGSLYLALTFLQLLVAACLLFLTSFVLSKRLTFNKLKSLEEKESQRALTIVNEGKTKVRELKNYTKEIHENEIAALVRELSKIGFEIYNNLEKHPEDIPKARSFINYYLDATIKIIANYIQIQKQPALKVESITGEKDIQTVLQELKKGYEKQLEALFENDALDLKVEIKVLDNMLKSEGLKK